MLRIHLLQIAYNMSDPQMEDFLHENSTARQFVGLALADHTPDEFTILQFRHLLEKHNLGKQVFERVNAGITANQPASLRGSTTKKAQLSRNQSDVRFSGRW